MPLALVVGVVLALGVTADLSEDSLRRAARLDSELNREYQRVMSLLPIEPKQQLRNAQRAWIAYRDKLCAFESTLLHADGAWLSKDTTPRKDITCIERLTEQRVRELKSYLATVKGSDVPESGQRDAN